MARHREGRADAALIEQTQDARQRHGAELAA